MNITAILLDDLQDCTENLSFKLKEHCPYVQIIGVFNSVQEAIPAIKSLKPDVLFLDIEMPEMSGFQMLETHFPVPGFQVVFTTAYTEYMLRAIRMSALDYLLKPIRVEELQASVERVIERKVKNIPQQEAIGELLKQYLSPTETVRLKEINGFETKYNQSEILYFEANENLLKMHICNNGATKCININNTLIYLESLLEKSGFIRTHRSFLVNTRHIKGFRSSSNDDHLIRLSNDCNLPVSRRNKEKFEEWWMHKTTA